MINYVIKHFVFGLHTLWELVSGQFAKENSGRNLTILRP